MKTELTAAELKSMKGKYIAFGVALGVFMALVGVQVFKK